MLRSDVSPGVLRLGWILAGLVGAASATLVVLGNPGNMGLCGACFLRDVAGAVGLSQSGPRVFRPEILGMMLGAFAWVALRGKFTARSGSHAATRFFFGMLMGAASLVFLGCPFRMLQRMGGGDLNAVIGLVGFVGGVGLGLWFEKKGYSVGKTAAVPAPVGFLPIFTGALVCGCFLAGALQGPGPGDEGAPAHAPWLWALLVATLAGTLLSATGFCAVSAARQIFLPRKRMLLAAVIFVVSYGLVAAAAGTFHWGFEGQPVAHQDGLWNILALAVVGLCGVLCGGCPVRQVIMSGEGNGDAFVTTMGIAMGGAVAHGLSLASTGAGPTEGGKILVVGGLVVAAAYGGLMARANGATSG